MKPAAPVTRMRAIVVPQSALRSAGFIERSEPQWIKQRPSERQPVAVRMQAAHAVQAAVAPAEQRRPKLLFLVTEDWYFCSHRLPVARAARDAGFEIAVATRVRDHASCIRAEGFCLHPLAWRRRGDGALGAARAVAEIAMLYRRERPDIVHHVALKPVVCGGLALRLAFPGCARRPAEIAAIAGLGSEFGEGGGFGYLGRPFLGRLLRRALVIAQNPEDSAALVRDGIDPKRAALIRGSGVDIGHFTPLLEPGGPTVRVALVARMLRSKGVIDAVSAIRRLRAEGIDIELLLAGAPDPDNRDSLSEDELAAIAAEPGIDWLGRVEDVRAVWQRAAIAVYPSTYGEGVPKALPAADRSSPPTCRVAAKSCGTKRTDCWCRRATSARWRQGLRRSSTTPRAAARWAPPVGRSSSAILPTQQSRAIRWRFTKRCSGNGRQRDDPPLARGRGSRRR